MPPTGPWAVGGQDGQAGSRCRPLHVIPLPGLHGALWLLVLLRRSVEVCGQGPGPRSKPCCPGEWGAPGATDFRGPQQAQVFSAARQKVGVGSELGQTSGVCESAVLLGRLRGAKPWSCTPLGSIHHLLRRGRGGARPWGWDSPGLALPLTLRLASLAWVCGAGIGWGRALAQNKGQGHRPAA